jgi:hypothetical protein
MVKFALMASLGIAACGGEVQKQPTINEVHPAPTPEVIASATSMDRDIKYYSDGTREVVLLNEAGIPAVIYKESCGGMSTSEDTSLEVINVGAHSGDIYKNYDGCKAPDYDLEPADFAHNPTAIR